MGRHLLFALFAVAISQQASAEVLKTVEHLAPPLSFDHLGNTDGLPNTDVKRIVQDKNGFIWFGTQDGLARYDGVRIKAYRSVDNDPTSFSGGDITALVLDPSGKIWVGTAENGIDLYDPDTDKFTRYLKGTKGGPSSDGVTTIVRDSKDRMWFAMNTVGLDSFDPKTGAFTAQAAGPLEAPVTSMDADKGGNLWLGTQDQGLVRWNPDDGKSTLTYKPAAGDARSIGASQINSVRVASTGKVWIGTDGDGLLELDAQKQEFVRYRHSVSDPASISDDHVTAIYEDKHNNIWIGTNNGLNRIAPNGQIEQYNHDPNDPTSLAFPQVETIFQDVGGVMWVGGFTSGVAKFDELRPKFGHYRTNGNPANSYWEDSDGTLWVGTYNGGLYHYDWSAREVTLYRTLGTPGEEGSIQLDSGWISAVHRDRRGMLWIALQGQGLIAFDTRTETYKQYTPDPDKGGLPSAKVWAIWEDPRGPLWLATFDSGLVKFESPDTVKAFTMQESTTGLTQPNLYTLYPDPVESKILWLGVAKGGLVKFDTTTGAGTAFKHKNDDPASLSSDDVISIYRDGSSNVWVGTYGGGLNRLDLKTGKVERFTTQNSKLTNDVVLGILPDDDGKLWLSTNGGGLLQYDPKANTFLSYDQSDGVQDNEFGQGSYFRDKSGKLFFGGVGGFNAFNPRDITRDSYVPPVVMTDFKNLNQEVKLDRPVWTLPNLEVSYSDSFELQFAALSFAAPGRNRYAYKLEGFDDKFIETDRPYATYTKLDGGSYTLRVRASNRHGAWNETGIAIKIRIKPPFYRTWPAFAGYIFVLAVAVFLLFRAQQLKVRRVEREGRLAVVERDLALSGAVQSGFLPEYNEINGGRLQLFGFYRAADACSGDWWWHEQFGSRHVVLVGDVTGHGPGPAMVTAAVATAFRVLVANGLGDVERALELLNDVVLHVAKSKYHMTMCALELDEATGQWAVHSAGAPPILSLDARGRHKVHFCPGSPLGTEEGFEIGRIDGVLAPGERILMYTDGIPEITLPNGNVLGLRRFAQMYERTRSQTVREAAASIIGLADQTQAGKPQADDWTFAIVEWGSYPNYYDGQGAPSPT
jgi:ligand-binding sensor domain-containing protein